MNKKTYGNSIQIEEDFDSLSENKKSLLLNTIMKNCMESLKHCSEEDDYEVSIVKMKPINGFHGLGWITCNQEEIKDDAWKGGFIKSEFVSKNSLSSYQSTIA